MSERHLARLLDRIRAWRDQWIVAEPTIELAAHAERMIARHGLRAADAIQLASAIATASPGSSPGVVVCLDRRLAAAATVEGFRIVPDPD